ncbi:acetyltransferase [Pseudoalteromonas sp. JBTF-M23]|uniref:Acetyltransferase n=1 Tax=Pseudoalteromonas caenipelagi TaxID=2726988 RepID=A0A849VIX5_9GAMM|nr:acetyltransferase [Pseudoalteromonas caenipelagi]NOU51774.1 acetyltransferase [Pseudoalteromonas caenipelagi]
MSKISYLMLGAGGHAAVLADILYSQGKELVGVVAPEVVAGHGIFTSVRHFDSDDAVLDFNPKDVLLVNGIGAMPRKSLRRLLYNRYRDLGYSFATIVADSAIVSEHAVLEAGAQVMQSAVINIGSRIGENSIVNTSATVEHDCDIGEHCHIAPGATLSGQVKLEKYVHVATGASVINNVTVGVGSIIGVGANVTQSIPSGKVVYGAKNFCKGRDDEY